MHLLSEYIYCMRRIYLKEQKGITVMKNAVSFWTCERSHLPDFAAQQPKRIIQYTSGLMLTDDELYQLYVVSFPSNVVVLFHRCVCTAVFQAIRV
eukprot:m.335535 g.335535  ORF g.335535 m.335535 type:complete len:95 (-) comp16076_c0_seq36:2409-2693(-)